MSHKLPVGDCRACRSALRFPQPRRVRSVRILVANTPSMYREAVAISLRLHRPDAEVMLGPPAAFYGRVERFGPHLVVLDHGDGLLLGGLPTALPRLELRLGATMDGSIGADGRAVEVEGICTEDLLALVDEVENTPPSRGGGVALAWGRSTVRAKTPVGVRSSCPGRPSGS